MRVKDRNYGAFVVSHITITKAMRDEIRAYAKVHSTDDNTMSFSWAVRHLLRVGLSHADETAQRENSAAG